jgi:hypothetical protein
MAAKDVMIDIETVSTKTDALVLSIAARKFECLHSGPKLDESVLITTLAVNQTADVRHLVTTYEAAVRKIA